MDPRVKVEGVEKILNFIAECINQPPKPEGLVYEQLSTIYKYYESKYGIVPLQVLQLHLHLEIIHSLCN